MKTNLPKVLEFQLTLDCQYNCAHCGNVKYGEQHTEPTFEQIISVVDCVMPTKVSFTGGEPTLRWDLLLKLIRYATSKGIITQLNTNGGGLSTDRVRELEASGLQTLHISLSTLNSRLYQTIRRIKDPLALKRALDTVEFGCEHTAMKIIPEALLLKSNLQEIDKIYTLVSSWGAGEFEIQNIIPTDPRMWKLVPKDRDILAMLDNLLPKRVSSTKITLCCLHLTTCYGFPNFSSIDGVDLYKCVCGREGAYITVTGDVYPCSFFHKNIGNAFEENIADFWGNSELVSRIQTELPLECKNCDLFEQCRNVCMAITFNKYERFDKRSYPIYSSESSSNPK